MTYAARVQAAQRRVYHAALLHDALVALAALAIGIAVGAGGFALAEAARP